MVKRVHFDRGDYETVVAEMGDMKPGDGRVVRCEDWLRTAAPSSELGRAPATPVGHQPGNVERLKPGNVERLSGIGQEFAVRLNVAAGAALARTRADGQSQVGLILKRQTPESPSGS